MTLAGLTPPKSDPATANREPLGSEQLRFPGPSNREGFPPPLGRTESPLQQFGANELGYGALNQSLTQAAPDGSMEAPMDIFTIGYEGAHIDAFVATLAAAGVETLVDVRAVAVSRRPGFSKTALGLRLTAEGIRYVHLRDLGDPKPGREAARAGRFRAFERIYDAHLATPAAVDALAEAGRLAGQSPIALMCFEADASHCHRTVIARRLAKAMKLLIVDLRVNNPGAAFGARAISHSGEGLAAA